MSGREQFDANRPDYRIGGATVVPCVSPIQIPTIPNMAAIRHLCSDSVPYAGAGYKHQGGQAPGAMTKLGRVRRIATREDAWQSASLLTLWAAAEGRAGKSVHNQRLTVGRSEFCGSIRRFDQSEHDSLNLPRCLGVVFRVRGLGNKEVVRIAHRDAEICQTLQLKVVQFP